MEPSEFDKYIRGKVQAEGNIHRAESEAARPVVWSSVQENIAQKNTLKWYHLAAAILLLCLVFGYYFVRSNQGYTKELDILTARIQELDQRYSSSNETLQQKEVIISELTDQVARLDSKIQDLQRDQPPPQIIRETLYEKDTVYISRVEYIRVPSPDTLPELTEPDQELLSAAPEPDPETQINDVRIFPSPSARQNTETDESLKVRFGKYQARTN